MDSQDQEIKTIRGRTITLELSDADVERIWNKAGSVNLTVSKLLENFIGDLVWGTYTNGSDERMYANEWFERCGFDMFSDKTFLGYLLEYGCIKEIIGLWEDIKDIKEELEYAKVHPAEYDADEINGLKEDLIDWQSSLDKTFGEYIESAKNEEVGTLDKEMETVIEWYEGMQQMKNSNTTLYKKDEDELENDMEL